jgi:hypothetical protein
LGNRLAAKYLRPIVFDKWIWPDGFETAKIARLGDFLRYSCSMEYGQSDAVARRAGGQVPLRKRYLLLIMLCGLVALPLRAQEKEWQETHDQIQKFNDAGKYSESLPLAIGNLQFAKDSFGLNQPNTATSLSDLGEVNLYLGEYAAAEPLLRRRWK